jgi:hypothetical protein
MEEELLLYSILTPVQKRRYNALRTRKQAEETKKLHAVKSNKGWWRVCIASLYALAGSLFVLVIVRGLLGFDTAVTSVAYYAMLLSAACFGGGVLMMRYW